MKLRALSMMLMVTLRPRRRRSLRSGSSRGRPRRGCRRHAIPWRPTSLAHLGPVGGPFQAGFARPEARSRLVRVGDSVAYLILLILVRSVHTGAAIMKLPALSLVLLSSLSGCGLGSDGQTGFGDDGKFDSVASSASWLGAAYSNDGTSVRFRVYSKAATRIRVDLFAEAAGADELA